MKLIIAGGRKFDDWEMLTTFMAAPIFLDNDLVCRITEIVSGCARGADKLGEDWAVAMKLPIKRFPANWNRQPDGSYDKTAGFRRNQQMADYADALIAFPGDNGTADMVERMKALGKPYIQVVGDW